MTLAAVVGAECALVLGGRHLVGVGGLALVLVAATAWAALVLDARVDGHPRLVLAGIAVVFAVGIATRPHGSADLWSYVADGRTLAVRGANPYVHPPADAPHDPFLHLVGRGWRHTTSVYGPLFTAVSAVLARVAGTSVLRARLAFQLLATAGVAGSLAVLWRSTRSAGALAFLGLHPAVATAIVNGGHNDALVGLGVLGAAVLAARRRFAGAGVVAGLAVLVKASAAFGAVGIVLWAARRDRRGAATLAAGAALTTVAGYLPFGLVAVRSAAHAGHGISRASIWDVPALLPGISAGIVAAIAAGLVVVAAWCWRRARRPEEAATGAAAAYLVGGGYVLPWYPAWVLPVAAPARRSWLSLLVAAHAVFLVAVYELELPAHEWLRGPAAALRTTLVAAGAIGAAVALAVLAVLAARAGRVPARDPARHG